MSAISVRENLNRIGELRPDKPSLHIPSSLHSSPKSLRAILHSTNFPQMESWTVKCEDHQAVDWWTYDCQGITTDGKYLYAVNANMNEHPVAIYKFNLDYGDAIRSARSPAGQAHIGPPNYYEGKIYVPVEGGTFAGVWTLDTELTTLSYKTLGGSAKPPQGYSMPWCAINPWNGFLYNSKFGDGGADGVTEVYGYDPVENFAFKKSLRLQSMPLYKVQGGCFSSNGHLYLTSHATKCIHGYNALNGAYLGSFSVPSDWSGGEEMEGIAIGNLTCKSTSDLVMVHVLVLDNDWPHRDSDIWLKHIAVPVYGFL